jgi:hypothetical protein
MASVCRYFVESKRQNGKHVRSHGRPDDSFTVPGVCGLIFHDGLLIDAFSRLYLFVERGAEKSTAPEAFFRSTCGAVTIFDLDRFGVAVRGNLPPTYKYFDYIHVSIIRA